MQIAFLPKTTADSPCHPSSSVAACSRTARAVMVHQPYVKRSRFLPCQEIAEVLVAAVVQDQTLQKAQRASAYRNCRTWRPSPKHQAPSQILSESGDAFVHKATFRSPLLVTAVC